MRFETPQPDLQITFFNRLETLRTTILLNALLRFVAQADIGEIDRQLSQFVPLSALQEIARCGLRGEVLFAVPYVLSERPQLVGYYRLLLGFSQKQFCGLRASWFSFFSVNGREISVNSSAARVDS